MLDLLARIVAHVAFPFLRPWAFIRANRTLLSLIVVTGIATVFATVGATALDRHEDVPDGQDASASGTFISANGTTSSEWQVAGPAGPNISGAISDAGTAISVNGTTANLGPTAATANIGNSNATVNINTTDLTVGLFINSGAFVLTGESGDILAMNANNTGNVTDYAAGQTTYPVGTITGSAGDFNITGFTQLDLQEQATIMLSMTSTGMVPKACTDGLGCGVGGTVTVQGSCVGLVITSGTLSSTCVIDFSTNASSGIFFADMSGATPGATFGIQFKNGTATKTYLSTGVIAGTLATVWTHGANTLAVTY
jgi:hypothetical protein